LGLNLAAGFDLFHKDVNLSSLSSFRTRTTGGSLRLGFPLTENLWLTNSYNLASSEIYDVLPTASLAIREAQGEAITSSWGTMLSYDGRNHPKNPTRGIYLQVGTEVAGLGGDVQYVRANAEGRFYYPLNDKITFVGRVMGGHIEGWGGQDVRLIDLFYKGGETIRGFDRGGFGPRDLLTNDALGGSTYWSATAELRFPIPFIPQELGMSAAAFVDAGSLFGAGAGAQALNTQCGVAVSRDPITGAVLNPGICLADSSAVRASAGASIIWESPLGPLRLDISKAFLKERFDDEQLIRFGASTRF
jgi:outer membrane protein insertion porin family